MSGRLSVLFYPSYAEVGPRYAVTLEGGTVRTGPGCGWVPSTTTCDAASVTEILVDAGEGDDLVNFGQDTIAPAAAPIPVAATVMLGPGDDTFAPWMAGQLVTVDGGDGMDTADLYTDESVGGSIKPHGVRSARVALGAGNDVLHVRGVPGGVNISGGPGNDDLSGILGSAGGTIAGDDGDDDVFVLAPAGRGTFLGGAGDDRLRTDEVDGGYSGETVTRAGPGNDTIATAPDGDRDVIDCGPGDDELTSVLEGGRPPLDNTYVDCPAVGVTVARSAAVAGRRAWLRVRARQRLAVTATLRRRSRVVGHAPRARLSKGTTVIPVRLRRRVAGQLRLVLSCRTARGDRSVVRRTVIVRAS